MEYHKIINLLDDTTNQPSKSRTINWVEINNEPQGTYNAVIKFKTSMRRSNLRDYSDTYMYVKTTTAVPNTSAQGVAPNNRKKVILKIVPN